MEVLLTTQVEKFIDSLEKRTKNKILRTYDLLKKFGYTLSMPHSKRIGTNLFELRIRGQQEVRIFYSYKNGTAVLVHGFVKKTQKTPSREIDYAIKVFRTLDI